MWVYLGILIVGIAGYFSVWVYKGVSSMVIPGYSQDPVWLYLSITWVDRVYLGIPSSMGDHAKGGGLTSLTRSGYEAAGEMEAEGTLVLEELKEKFEFDFLFLLFHFLNIML